MNFELNDEQQAYIASAKAFSDKALSPHAAQWDAESIFPKETLRAAGELGFMGMYTPESAGGLGMGRLDASLIVEELAKGCTTTAAFLTIHNMATAMIGKYCQESAVEAWCPGLVMGEQLASYCLTEPGAGSDAANRRNGPRGPGTRCDVGSWTDPGDVAAAGPARRAGLRGGGAGAGHRRVGIRLRQHLDGDQDALTDVLLHRT